MRRAYSGVLGMALVLTAAVAGCSDQPGPLETQLGAGGISAAQASVSTDSVVEVLRRDAPLPVAISVTAVVSPEGGTLQLPEAGLNVHFPSGALSKPIRITVTAMPGSNVAYTFAPHGIRFRQPVVIDQAYEGTNAFSGGMSHYQGAYFPDVTRLDNVNGRARVSEFLPLSVDPLDKKLRFSVHHFSGYLVSIDRR